MLTTTTEDTEWDCHEITASDDTETVDGTTARDLYEVCLDKELYTTVLAD